MDNTVLKNIIAAHHETGGSTTQLTPGVGYGWAPTAGYAVAIHPEREGRVCERLTVSRLARYVMENKDLLLEVRDVGMDYHLGTWQDGETTVLDCVVVIPFEHVAIDVAVAFGQRAIYNLARRKVIEL